MKKIFSASLFILYFLSGFCQQSGIKRLTPDQFVILPWGWTKGDLAVYKDIYDCGFNLAGFVGTDDLNKVAQAGLKAIVMDRTIEVNDKEAGISLEEISKRVNGIAGKTAGNKAVFGYYLRDEPGAAVFPGLKNWKDAWTKAAPEALAYINLFPNYANNEAQLQSKDYLDYLERYVSIVKPSFISYDNYSLMNDGTLKKGYFDNLGAVRNIALKNNIPFWNIVLSNTHFIYIEPSYASLCFQLYTTLAYGGKGISYFTYFAPDFGNYRFAPVDQFGHKTPTWYILQNVNLQMHAIGQTYTKLKSVNVFHYPKIEECPDGLESSHFLSSLKGDHLLVGEFEDPGNTPYIIVVNKSIAKSQALDVTFKEKGSIWQVNNYTGASEPWTGERVWIAPGQGTILFLKREKN
jgi:hypothetical protein